MSTNRPGRIDRAAAEQLLSGATDGRQGGPGALSELLAAAAAPGTPRELVGEQAALAAFREAARLAPSPAPAPSQPRRRSMADCAPARFLSAKIAAAALTATALGGVAVAAGTGNLPVAFGGSPAGTPVAHPSPLASISPYGQHPGSGRPSPDGHGRSTGQPDDGTAPTGPAALCRAWAGAGQPTADPEFAPLPHEAGGAGKVRAYCAKLLGADGGASDGASDGASGSASGSADPRGGGNAQGNGGRPSDGDSAHGKNGGDGRPTAKPTTSASADPTPTRDRPGQGEQSPTSVRPAMAWSGQPPAH
ncbi:hypothetical protein P3T36_000532 [Kitasatospora sp. MAP12-15]|uniref:hypothetical protein n=1 Tax=unclassified Kitasatospora TaxID=2633591 RepID=UPI002474372C|nr:hypothetical protein [Kitasatospora sp. MAP12-44]MDH6114131.1 hypothetical protein [Kitasatospora sp. MAP12-44]